LGLFDFFRSRPVLTPGDWSPRLEKAQGLLDGLHYRAAIDVLTPLAEDPRPDPAVAPLLPTVLGLLGECWFQSGMTDRAVAPTVRALDLLRRDGTAEERLALLGNLYEIHRYRGDGAQAGDCAEEMAGVLASLEQQGQAERYRRQARLVRAGEPLNRVVVELDGVRCELEEVLQGRSGAVRFVFERNRLMLRPAVVRIEEAGGLANKGRFPDALTLLLEAVAVDRFAPDPHYRAGLALIYMERYEEAVEALAACEERAPGWFLCRPARWLAEELARGTISHETFVAWHALEEGPLSAEAKIALAERALEIAPDLALLHLLHGLNLKARNALSPAVAAYRRGLALAVRPDVRTRLLVELATVVDSDEEKRRLLRQAVEIDGDLIAAATARVVLAFE
jgi:tetratricopeptide (TPR) repeat protein